MSDVRQHKERLLPTRRLSKVDGWVSCQLLQKQIVGDGKPGLADYVGCIAASTSLGMTKKEDTYPGIGAATAQQRSSKMA